jgi:hypothetical protein
MRGCGGASNFRPTSATVATSGLNPLPAPYVSGLPNARMDAAGHIYTL